jgi:hypothetical protein
MQPNITIIDKSKVRIAAFECDTLGKVSQKTIDLTQYAGQHIRIWLDPDGSYSLNPKRDHYWQMAELDVPEIQFSSVDTGEIDEEGNPIMAAEALPLDLTAVEIEKWELPE